MTESEETTGVAGGGTAFARPLPTTAEDGARIVYVAIPNEDSIAVAQQRWAKDMELSPRIHAMNMALNYRDFTKRSLEQVITDASTIEAYLNQGTVPAIPEGASSDD